MGAGILVRSIRRRAGLIARNRSTGYVLIDRQTVEGRIVERGRRIFITPDGVIRPIHLCCHSAVVCFSVETESCARDEVRSRARIAATRRRR